MSNIAGAAPVSTGVGQHSRMSRSSKILICAVSLIAAVVIGLPVLARWKSRSSSIPACHFNLEQIRACKQLWADNEEKTTNGAPTWGDLRPYFSQWLMTNSPYWTNGRPICPGGGTYTISRVGELPRCSIGGGYSHSLRTGNGYSN
jgi:hypothetical protein